MDYSTKLVGIVNITPDSISSNFSSYAIDEIASHVESLIAGGADIVDVGAESTNPQSEEISAEEEQSRLRPVLNELFLAFPGVNFSLDTRNGQTADMFLDMGGMMINDYSGVSSLEMLSVLQNSDCLCVVNHFPNRSVRSVHSMKKIDSISIVRYDLINTKQRLVESGIDSSRIILDPGIGFGKTVRLNWELLRFKEHAPADQVYVGFSKKRFLGPYRFDPVINKYAGLIALESKTDFIRLHEPQLLNFRR